MKVYTLDAKHLLCPLPVIRVQDYVKRTLPGYYLEVLCTDPGAKLDVPSWCRIQGYEVCDIAEDKNEIKIKILIK